MGKKSRRAKDGGSKASRKERLQERRERTVDTAAAADQENIQQDDHSPRRTYFAGDRVWFDSHWSDGSNPNTYRGIVHQVREDSLRIIPLQAKIDGRDEVWTVDIDDVFPDFCQLTLRFDVGDRVVCNTEDGWVPLVVEYQWPIYDLRELPKPKKALDSVPNYKCGSIGVPLDHDYFIVRHPLSFRFSVGDKIVFDPKKAFATGKSSRDLDAADSWCEGIVTELDITSQKVDYFAYQCSFGSSGKARCFITKDTDEHIAGRHSDPRERLFEAITQDCTMQHLAYLASFYSIDVSTFRDMVVSKAIEYGSYNALLWLQEDFEFDIVEVRDASGNNLLHKIAMSEYAARFIEKLASRRRGNAPELDATSLSKFNKVAMSNEMNIEGQTWLNILVNRGDVKALDAALSPCRDLSWDISRSYIYFDREQLASLRDCVQRSGNQFIQLIFDTFESISTMKHLYDCIDDFSFGEKTEDELLEKDELSLLLEGNVEQNAKRFVRFVYDWQATKHVRSNVLFNLVRRGYYTLFLHFYEANKTWFWEEKAHIHPNQDDNEYVQPELSPDRKESATPKADIIEICMIGGDEYKHYGADINTKSRYISAVRCHFQFCRKTDCPALTSHLKNEAIKDRYGYIRFVKYKISLLEDSESLEGRLKILSHVVRDRPGIQLDALVPIRFRQCGVLRWMVENEMIDLDANTRSLSGTKILGSLPQSFHFTKGQQMPPIPFGCFLCFASVECDDLFSLQWLCETHGYPDTTCEGLNILHLAALLGRIEIIGWLHSMPGWAALVEKACAYGKYAGSFPVHIAAGQGHVEVANLLLEFGCTEYDSRSRPPEYYARNAPFIKSSLTGRDYKFAHDWAEERREDKERTSNTKRGLESSIEKLLQLLKGKASKPLKDHISGSKCLDMHSWIQSGCEVFDDPGPTGLSYGDVVDKCLTFHDSSFADWLLIRLQRWDHDYYYNTFWRETAVE